MEDEVKDLARAQGLQANMLSTERQKLLQMEMDARQAQRDAEERAQHAEEWAQNAEAETHQHCLKSKWPFTQTANFCSQ